MAIVNLTLSVDSQYVPRILAAIGKRMYRRRGRIQYPDGPPTATPEDVRQELMGALKEWVLEEERADAAASAAAGVQEVPIS